MMAIQLDGKRVAILATNGFEQSELTEPRRALLQAGAEAEVVAPGRQRLQAMLHRDKGGTIAVDCALDRADPEEYAALVVPGGLGSPDALRADDRALAFVRHFFDRRKPVAAIGRGPWTLIEANVVRGRKMTSSPSLKTDLRRAGADWVDAAVVVDETLVTCRKADDLPVLCTRMLETIRANW